MSHDAGIASAFVVLESRGARGERGASARRMPRRRARSARPSIDLDAIARNVRTIAERVAPAEVMAVVKANAYGHGAVEAARAALAGGATRLGVADLDEALELREAGIDAPILAWLHDPDADFAAAVAADVEIGVSSLDQLERAAAAAGGIRRRGHPPPCT